MGREAPVRAAIGPGAAGQPPGSPSAVWDAGLGAVVQVLGTEVAHSSRLPSPGTALAHCSLAATIGKATQT